jgi:ubiquinone/menaquinone biosynthesis C-methylase UbiE
MSELEEIKSRYNRRENLPSDRYSILSSDVYLIEQEKERNLIKWINENNIAPVSNKKLLEIGCGTGNNILTFLKLGFQPENIFANELLENRYTEAKKKLPQAIQIIPGNALDIEFPNNEFDIVFQSMVFSSILDDQFKLKLAQKIFNLTKSGGGVLWYDFIYNNPQNKDVMGIRFQEIKKLFPNSVMIKQKITLAPPLARFVTRVHPKLYYVFNSFFFLRTHLLVWIKKK